MLPFTVDILPGAPVYEQVVFAVKKAILSGLLRPEDPFPSVRTLSQELRINPNTAHKVVAALIADGLLVVRPGLGTTVAAPSAGSTEDRTLLLEGDLERLVVEARRLGLKEEQVIAAIQRHWKKYHPS